MLICRHAHMSPHPLKKFSEKFEVDNWIIQKRENIFTDSYTIKKNMSELEKIHFLQMLG